MTWLCRLWLGASTSCLHGGGQKKRSAEMKTAEPLTDRMLTERPAWKELETHNQEVRKLHLRQLFAADDQRGKKMTAEAAGIYLDYSKNRITSQTIELLLQLAEQSG